MKISLNKILLIILLSLVAFSCSKKAKDEIKSDVLKSISFNNSEVRYFEKIYHKSYGDCSNKKDCAEIKVEYPEIISNGAYSDSINNYIQSQIYSLSFNEDKYKSLDEISDSLFSNYIGVQKEFNNYHTGWFINSKVLISGITNNTLSIKSEETIYTGGANTFYNLSFTNFDILTGKTLHLTDIVSEKNLSSLENIGRTIFYNLKKIAPNRTEEEAGFWFEKKRFELNDNFAITDSGLVFFYNLYEIASRAEGTTELFIPKEKIINITNIYK